MGYVMVNTYDNKLSRFHAIPERNGRMTDLLYQYRASVRWHAMKKYE